MLVRKVQHWARVTCSGKLASLMLLCIFVFVSVFVREHLNVKGRGDGSHVGVQAMLGIFGQFGSEPVDQPCTLVPCKHR